MHIFPQCCITLLWDPKWKIFLLHIFSGLEICFFLQRVVGNDFQHPCAILFIFNPASFQLTWHSAYMSEYKFAAACPPFLFSIVFRQFLITWLESGREGKGHVNPRNIQAWIFYIALHLGNCSHVGSGLLKLLDLILWRVASRKQFELSFHLCV